MLWGWGNRYAHQLVMKMIIVVLGKQSGNIYQNKKYYTLQLSTLSLGNLLLGNKSHSSQEHITTGMLMEVVYGCLWRLLFMN